MKKQTILLITLGIVLIIVVLFLGTMKLNSKKEKKEEQEGSPWGAIASQYDYNPEILTVEIPDDFKESEIIDIYIVKKDSTKEVLLKGVYSWRMKNDNAELGILVPREPDFRSVLRYLPEALEYTFSIEKSDKKLGNIEINESLFKELMQHVEIVEPIGVEDIYSNK